MHARSSRPPARPLGATAAALLAAFATVTLFSLVCAAITLALLFLSVAPSFAATPASGTLDNAHPTVTWTGSITGAVTGVGEVGCVDGVSCDSFQVVLAPG